MPSLNWDVFRNLSGAAGANFETLCRILIRHHYGQYGDFRALAQQPGVEFHLRLQESCSLGNPGRWYGWQCRWYSIDSGRAIGTRPRQGITDAITKTEQVLPQLTDWVLWTRNTLTKADQDWFYSIETRMRLHLWTADDVEAHLSGEAEIYRSTYFGDLILTPNFLTQLHVESTAPIKERWLREVYQTLEAECDIRKMLIDESVWNNIDEIRCQIKRGASELETEMDEAPASLHAEFAELAELSGCLEKLLQDAYSAITTGNLDLLVQLLSESHFEFSKQLGMFPRKLRAKQHKAVFIVTNLLADIRSASRLLVDVKESSETRQVAVVAEYGCGKTCLAAELTSTESNGLAAGILLHGRDLSAGDDLNDLANKVIVQGYQVPSMEALIADTRQ